MAAASYSGALATGEGSKALAALAANSAFVCGRGGSEAFRPLDGGGSEAVRLLDWAVDLYVDDQGRSSREPALVDPFPGDFASSATGEMPPPGTTDREVRARR